MHHRLTRYLGVLACAGVIAVHVHGQGGMTGWAGPPWWMGIGFYVLELSLAFAAIALLVGREVTWAWCVTSLVALTCVMVYLITHIVQIGGDTTDAGHWRNTLGSVGLIFDLLLIGLSVIGVTRHDPINAR